MLLEKDELILKHMDLKTTFNNHFGRIFQNLGLFSQADVSSEAIFNLKITGKFDQIVNQHRNNHSLFAVKKTCNITPMACKP